MGARRRPGVGREKLAMLTLALLTASIASTFGAAAASAGQPELRPSYLRSSDARSQGARASGGYADSRGPSYNPVRAASHSEPLRGEAARGEPSRSALRPASPEPVRRVQWEGANSTAPGSAFGQPDEREAVRFPAGFADSAVPLEVDAGAENFPQQPPAQLPARRLDESELLEEPLRTYPTRQPMELPPEVAAERRCLTDQDVGSIRRIDLDLRLPEGDIPKECQLLEAEYYGRAWCCITYHWTASALCHKPLYFEEWWLERYGHSWGPGLQEAASGAHFFATIPMLPYKMLLEDPCQCIYPLGYYRPGNCAPKMLYPVRYSCNGPILQPSAAASVVFLLP